jgi:3-dehydroquinate dehydratase/shikimate dehydrogenase
MSPAIHNAGFADVGFNKLYLPLLVEGGYDDFEEFMDNLLRRSWLGFKGFSVTIPHKENALEYVKDKGGQVEPLAEKIGAVNTIVVGPDGKLFGYNTDYAGAIEAIAEKIGGRGELDNMDVAVVGAGGVSRAIVAGLVDAGAKVKIYNRTTRKAKKLAKQFGCEYAPLNKAGGIDAKLLINCTSVGMSPKSDNSPVPVEVHREGMVVFDTVYNPLETLFLRHAKAGGAETIDGLEMFVNQAMMQFELFTGTQGNRQFMRKTVLDLLEK